MSLIWPHRAQLVTPWNLTRLSPHFLLDADPGHVELYDATHLATLKDWSGWDDAARNPTQATFAAMPIYTAANAAYGGHGTLNFAYAQKLVSGVFSQRINQPATFYFVGRPNITGSAGILFDTLVGHRLYTVNYSTVTVANAGGAGIQSVGVYNNTPIVYCLVANTTSSAQYFNNSTTPDGIGSIGTDYATGISIGCDASGGTLWKGDWAHLSGFPGAHDQPTRLRAMRYLYDQFKQVGT